MLVISIREPQLRVFWKNSNIIEVCAAFCISCVCFFVSLVSFVLFCLVFVLFLFCFAHCKTHRGALQSNTDLMTLEAKLQTALNGPLLGCKEADILVEDTAIVNRAMGMLQAVNKKQANDINCNSNNTSARSMERTEMLYTRKEKSTYQNRMDKKRHQAMIAKELFKNHLNDMANVRAGKRQKRKRKKAKKGKDKKAANDKNNGSKYNKATTKVSRSLQSLQTIENDENNDILQMRIGASTNKKVKKVVQSGAKSKSQSNESVRNSIMARKRENMAAAPSSGESDSDLEVMNNVRKDDNNIGEDSV